MQSLTKIGELVLGLILSTFGLFGLIYTKTNISLYQGVGFIFIIFIGLLFLKSFFKSAKFKLTTNHAVASATFIILLIPLIYISFKAFLFKSKDSGVILGTIGLILLVYSVNLLYIFIKKVRKVFFKRIKKTIKDNWKFFLKTYLIVTAIFALVLFVFVTGGGPLSAGITIIVMEILVLTWLFIAPIYEDILKKN